MYLVPSKYLFLPSSRARSSEITSCTCTCGFVGYLTNRQQFFMVCTLVDHRNDVKMCKVEPRTAGEGFHCKVLNIGTSFLLSICFSPSLKTADTSQRHHWFSREMTTEERAQKFHTDEAHYPDLGSASDWSCHVGNLP